MPILGRASLAIAGLLACFMHQTVASGQQLTRTELGVGVYGQSDTYNVGTSSATRTQFIGPMLRGTVNLNSAVALEALVTDSWDNVPTDDREGGHETLALAGVKAGVRRSFFGIYGLLDLGTASYSHGDELYTSPLTFYRETDFALQPGLAVEGYLGRRTIIRADVAEHLSAAFRSPVTQLSANESLYIPGMVSNHLGVSLSVEHRFGELYDAPPAEGRGERFTVGAFFPLQIREHTLEQNTPALGGGGAWVEIPNYRFLSTDIVAFDLQQDDHTGDAYDGGTSFSGFAGPKIGLHVGRLGLFAKGRPGIARFSRTESSLNLTSTGLFQYVDHPQIDFSLDTGGVVEYVPVRHLVLRLEAGDAMTFYRSKTVAETFSRTKDIFTAPAERKDSILFLSGLGWRF